MNLDWFTWEVFFAGAVLYILWRIGNRIDEIYDHIQSIRLSLEHLEPLVQEGKALWEIESDREMDRLGLSLGANIKVPDDEEKKESK